MKKHGGARAFEFVNNCNGHGATDDVRHRIDCYDVFLFCRDHHFSGQFSFLLPASRQPQNSGNLQIQAVDYTHYADPHGHLRYLLLIFFQHVAKKLLNAPILVGSKTRTRKTK